MKLRNIFILVRKDLLLSFKDWELALIVFLPMVSMIVIGYGIDNIKKNPPKSKVVVTDLDGGEFTTYLEKEEKIKILEKVSSWEDAGEVMMKKDAHLALLIPEGFSSDLREGRQPKVHLIFDVDKLGRRRQLTHSLEEAMNHFANRQPLVEFKVSFSKGTEISVQSYLLQFGLVFQIIMVCMMFLPLSVGEEKEKGCLEALVLSPATMNEIVIAKVVYSSGVCFLSSLLMTALYASKVSHLGLTIAYALFGALCFSAIGIAIAISAKNRKHGSLLGTGAMLIMIMPMSFKDLFPFVESMMVILPSEWLMRGLQQLSATEATITDQGLNFGLLLAAGIGASIWSLFAVRRYDGAIE